MNRALEIAALLIIIGMLIVLVTLGALYTPDWRPMLWGVGAGFSMGVAACAILTLEKR